MDQLEALNILANANDLGNKNRAPAGGVTINGTFYRGGLFIPGDQMKKASKTELKAFRKGARNAKTAAKAKKNKKKAKAKRSDPQFAERGPKAPHTSLPPAFNGTAPGKIREKKKRGRPRLTEEQKLRREITNLQTKLGAKQRGPKPMRKIVNPGNVARLGAMAALYGGAFKGRQEFFRFINDPELGEERARKLNAAMQEMNNFTRMSNALEKLMTGRERLRRDSRRYDFANALNVLTTAFDLHKSKNNPEHHKVGADPNLKRKKGVKKPGSAAVKKYDKGFSPRELMDGLAEDTFHISDQIHGPNREKVAQSLADAANDSSMSSHERNAASKELSDQLLTHDPDGSGSKLYEKVTSSPKKSVRASAKVTKKEPTASLPQKKKKLREKALSEMTTGDTINYLGQEVAGTAIAGGAAQYGINKALDGKRVNHLQTLKSGQKLQTGGTLRNFAGGAARNVPRHKLSRRLGGGMAGAGANFAIGFGRNASEFKRLAKLEKDPAKRARLENVAKGYQVATAVASVPPAIAAKNLITAFGPTGISKAADALSKLAVRIPRVGPAIAAILKTFKTRNKTSTSFGFDKNMKFGGSTKRRGFRKRAGRMARRAGRRRNLSLDSTGTYDLSIIDDGLTFHALNQLDKAMDLGNKNRAPIGGATINGTFYPGGRFIPADQMAKASPKERQALKTNKKKDTKLKKRDASGFGTAAGLYAGAAITDIGKAGERLGKSPRMWGLQWQAANTASDFKSNFKGNPRYTKGKPTFILDSVGGHARSVGKPGGVLNRLAKFGASRGGMSQVMLSGIAGNTAWKASQYSKAAKKETNPQRKAGLKKKAKQHALVAAIASVPPGIAAAKMAQMLIQKNQTLQAGTVMLSTIASKVPGFGRVARIILPILRKTMRRAPKQRRLTGGIIRPNTSGNLLSNNLNDLAEAFDV